MAGDAGGLRLALADVLGEAAARPLVTVRFPEAMSVGATVRSNAVLNLVTQLLGAALVVPGLLSWFAGGMQDVGARRSAAISLLIFELIGFGVSFFVGMLPKVMSPAGWAVVALFLLFTVGFAYFLFMRPSEI